MTERSKSTKKAFREFLNKEHIDTAPHSHNRFRQRKREYGDYLYFQDRAKFDWEYEERCKQQAKEAL